MGASECQAHDPPASTWFEGGRKKRVPATVLGVQDLACQGSQRPNTSAKGHTKCSFLQGAYLEWEGGGWDACGPGPDSLSRVALLGLWSFCWARKGLNCPPLCWLPSPERSTLDWFCGRAMAVGPPRGWHSPAVGTGSHCRWKRMACTEEALGGPAREAARGTWGCPTGSRCTSLHRGGGAEASGSPQRGP